MIDVAAGILVDAHGRVLLMQRLPGKHLAGLWEFPGGKVEPDETAEQALVRELDEELGIEVRAAAPLISLPWHYPETSVRLHAWRVGEWLGEPRAREGNPLRWTALHDIDSAAMPPADVPIVTALRLPPYYVIFAPDGAHPEIGVAKAPNGAANPLTPTLSPSGRGRQPRSAWRVRGGAATNALWQLRIPDASRAEAKRVARQALEVDPSLRGTLLINHDIGLARELRVGVHLKAAQLRELRERPLPQEAWVAASCHGAGELELAARLGVDFATLSPVQATASHPDAEPLGWARFARLVADARLPVYALGGVGPGDLARARGAGAQGVAGIQAFRSCL